MAFRRLPPLLVTGLFLLRAGVFPSAHAFEAPQVPDSASSRIQALRAELEALRLQLKRLTDEYQKTIKKLTQQLKALEAELQKANEGASPPAERPKSLQPLTDEELDRITAAAAPASPAQLAQGEPPPPAPAPEPPTPAPSPPSPQVEPPSAEAPPPEAPPTPPPAAHQAPKTEGEEEREVTRVPLAAVERGGVLLQPGKLQMDTSLAYTHTRNTRLILTGFSVIPLIILGTLESEKVTQDALTSTITLRYGLMKDLVVDVRIPTSFQAQSRVRLSNERVGLVNEDATQWGLGDIEAGVTYQPLYEKGWLPDLTVSLRLRAPTGRSQFDIFEKMAKQGPFLSVEDFVSRLNAEGLPLGSGFWGLTGSISGVKAFDPAVVFGTLGYTYNFPQEVTLIEITGLPAEGGILLRPQAVKADLTPGGSLLFSLGFALTLTREMAVSFAFSDRETFSSKRNGTKIADSRLNVGQFNAGFTLALSRRVTLDFSGGIGLTADAPDLTFTFSVPVTFDSVKELWPF